MSWAEVSAGVFHLRSALDILPWANSPSSPAGLASSWHAATDPADGIGLCFASSERLLQTKAIVYLATHFKALTKLTMYPNVEM